MDKVGTDYRTELNKNSVIAFVPRGNSMWPTLKGGKQSVVVAKKEGRLSYFDVALYVRDDGTNVLHRVMKVENDGYVMLGDSQYALEKVKEEQVLGVMVGFYRGEKYVDANDVEYLKKVEKWFRKKFWRKLRLKVFYSLQKIKRIFSKRKVK